MAAPRIWIGAAALVALAGCAIGATLRSYDVAPNGLERSEERLRIALTRARADSAVRPADGELARDALVRLLYRGTFAYYSGDFKEAGARFDEADAVTEDRYTKSVSQNALAMLTNDRELDYEPGINERLLMHYYGALAFWRGGDREGAAVEARKLAFLLQRHGADTTARDRSLRHALRVFAGVVFEATGERNDALVSYRNARAMLGKRVNADSSETLPSDALTADSGDVVVVVEQGFVAFPMPWDLNVAIYKHEWGYLSGEDRGRGSWMSARTGTRIAMQLGDDGVWWGASARTLEGDERWAAATAGDGSDVNLGSRPGAQYGYRYDPRWDWRAQHVVAKPERFIRLSVPVYKRPRVPPAASLLDAPGPIERLAVADLSDAEVADFDRVRAWTYARAVLRVAVKAAAAELAEKAAKEAAKDKNAKDKAKDERNAERWGWLAGLLTSASGAVLERADTRNWNMLPQGITLLRLRAPIGTHDLRLGAPSMPGGVLVIPKVDVRAGRVTLATGRLWNGPGEW